MEKKETINQLMVKNRISKLKHLRDTKPRTLLQLKEIFAGAESIDHELAATLPRRDTVTGILSNPDRESVSYVVLMLAWYFNTGPDSAVALFEKFIIDKWNMPPGGGQIEYLQSGWKSGMTFEERVAYTIPYKRCGAGRDPWNRHCSYPWPDRPSIVFTELHKHFETATAWSNLKKARPDKMCPICWGNEGGLTDEQLDSSDYRS